MEPFFYLPYLLLKKLICKALITTFLGLIFGKQNLKMAMNVIDVPKDMNEKTEIIYNFEILEESLDDKHVKLLYIFVNTVHPNKNEKKKIIPFLF